MKLNSSLVWVLGAVAAIALPAVVAAQQFQSDRPLTADALNELVRRIGVLESDNSVGNTVVLSPIPSTTDGTLEPVSFTARADGIVSFVPAGGSFQTAQTIVRTSVGGRESTIVRTRDGNSASFPVRSGQTFTVEATVAGTNVVDINLFFTPIRGNDAF